MMQTIQVRGKTGPDGVLQLSVPLGMSEAEFELVIVAQPATADATDRGWPPGYFEEVIGSITDETFFPDVRDHKEQSSS